MLIFVACFNWHALIFVSWFTASFANYLFTPANICLDKDVFKTSFVFLFRRRLKEQDEYIRFNHTSSEDGLVKTILFVLVIRLQDVLLIHLYDVFKNIFKTSWKCIFKTCSKYLQEVLKTSSKRFKISSRRLAKMCSRHFQEVSLSSTVLVNTSSRRIQHVSETYWKEGYLQKDLLRSHFWEIHGQCRNFGRVVYKFFS